MLGTVCANVVRPPAEGDDAPLEVTPLEVTPQALAGLLGAPAPADARLAGHIGRPGVTVGLYCTEAGGDMLVVEAGRMPGSGRLTLAGQLGEVVQGVGQGGAVVAARPRGALQHRPAFSLETDVHLNLSGGVPTEGASAGVTMATVLVSVFTGRPSRGGLAMAGEITLSGHVLPVGRIRDKVLAAHRYRLTHVILPDAGPRRALLVGGPGSENTAPPCSLGPTRRRQRAARSGKMDPIWTLARRPPPPRNPDYSLVFSDLGVVPRARIELATP